MAHYAFLNENNVVTEVIVGKDEEEDGVDWEMAYASFRGQSCKRTSYNTRLGVHVTGGVPFRKNYAGIGYTYNADIDAFVPPKPFASWVLNNETAQWEAPVPMPEDAGTGEPPKMYSWDEETTSWVLIEPAGNTET
jgi:hypothetical protein